MTAEKDSQFAIDLDVIAAATPAPWVAHAVDDYHCMNARTISRAGGTGELDDHENNVAILLLQEPRFADVADHRWDANAAFILRARDRWPKAITRIASLEKQIETLRKQNAELRAKLAGEPRK